MTHHVVQREVEWLDTPLETNVLLVLTGVHDDVRHRLESGVEHREGDVVGREVLHGTQYAEQHLATGRGNVRVRGEG